jgi:aspartate oxidase
VTTGHAFIQNPRRCRYELGTEARHKHLRVAPAFDELAKAIYTTLTVTESARRSHRSINATVPHWIDCLPLRDKQRKVASTTFMF